MDLHCLWHFFLWFYQFLESSSVFREMRKYEKHSPSWCAECQREKKERQRRSIAAINLVCITCTVRRLVRILFHCFFYMYLLFLIQELQKKAGAASWKTRLLFPHGKIKIWNSRLHLWIYHCFCLGSIPYFPLLLSLKLM